MIYKVYHIKKGNKSRQIEEPSIIVKAQQLEILDNLQKIAPLKYEYLLGGTKNASIQRNANIHKYAKYLLQIDIKDCFQDTFFYNLNNAIDEFYPQVKKEYSPGQLLNSCFFFNKERQKWHLPTGAPTSPYLLNMSLTPVDDYICKLLTSSYYRYSRYIDDIVISTCDKRHWHLLTAIEAKLNELDFKINKNKSKWITCKKDTSIVTGVNIGQGKAVPRQYKRKLRVHLDKLAQSNENLDQQTLGMLSYIQSISKDQHEYFLNYFKNRVKHHQT